MNREKRISLGGYTTDIRFTPKEECLLLRGEGKRLIVFDSNTERIFSRQSPVDREERAVVLPAGEEHKNWKSVEMILNRALETEMSRDDAVFGAGGGVVCDTAAFAASLFMRGARCVLVPTSLLAMVDASIGGKTGIDYGGYKNMVGTFYPAEEIRICTDVLSTLPRREYLSGIAEVIKHALLGDPDLLSLMETGKTEVLAVSPEAVNEMVMRSIELKGAVVESDFREQGRRAFLNLGHTFGHALESSTGFSRYSHGEAVAWGIHAALLAGLYMGKTDTGYAERVAALLESYGFTLQADGDPEMIKHAIMFDKKKRKGTPRFVLQRGLGDTFIESIGEPVLTRVLRECTR